MSVIDKESDRESSALWEPRLQDAAVEVALQSLDAAPVQPWPGHQPPTPAGTLH